MLNTIPSEDEDEGENISHPLPLSDRIQVESVTRVCKRGLTVGTRFIFPPPLLPQAVVDAVIIVHAVVVTVIVPLLPLPPLPPSPPSLQLPTQPP